MPEPAHSPQQMRCPACRVEPGQLHKDECDTAHCPETGRQRLMCDHDGDCESRWTGDYVGAAECREWGWWVLIHPQPGLGLVPCLPGAPDSIEDLNRLLTHALWDADTQRYIRITS